MSSIDNLQEIYQFTIEIAEQAGELLVQSANERMDNMDNIDYSIKENNVDIVTKVDSEVELFIREKIKGKFPEHEFIGEETYSKEIPKSRYIISKDKPTWCVDPLDGTVNFVHLFPMVCVSIALIIDGWPVIGVINAPFLKQTFSSYKNGGSWLNKTIRLPLIRNPLPIISPKSLLLNVEWGKDRDLLGGNLQKKISSFIQLARNDDNGGYVHGVRSLGSAALDMAYIAMGSSDIFWELGCWEWDIAAGVLLVEESGGLVTFGNPQDEVRQVHLGGRNYLAIRSGIDTREETNKEQQIRVVKEVWKRVESIEYHREGV